MKVKNLHIAITIYEALIAFEIGEWSKGHEESVDKIDHLFRAYTRLVDFIKMVQYQINIISSFRTYLESHDYYIMHFCSAIWKSEKVHRNRES